MSEPKKKPGRPTSLPPTVPVQVMITPQQRDWLMNHNESASEVVRRLISAAMKKDES